MPKGSAIRRADTHCLKRAVPLLLIALAWTLSLFAPPAVAEDRLSLAIRGKQVAQLSLTEIREKVPARPITVWEPHEKKNVTYEGFDTRKLFAAVYGEDWAATDEVLFTCADGYQPVVPTARMKSHASYLVYRRLDQPEFTVENRLQNEKDVALGPFYLVWDNLGSQELRDLGANGWPYQVVGADLVTFADRFPRMSPPQAASDQVKKGFVAFRENCMACHTINGEGGSKAPELNYPTSVTEYFSDQWIRQWVMEPRFIRYNATMPAFSTQAGADRLVEEVLAYLKAMAGNKREPE